MKIYLTLLITLLTQTLWAETFNLSIGGMGNEYGTHIIETSDKGFLIVGYTSGGTTRGEDGLIIKLDKKGNVLWSKNIGNLGTDRLYGCIELNSHYYVVGNSTSTSNKGGQDAWCTKLNLEGDIIWSKTFGGLGDDGFYKLLNLGGNRLAICGYSGGTGEQYAYLYLVKIGENGDIFFEKKYGSGLTNTQTNTARNLTLAPNGAITLSGYTYCFGAGMHDGIIVSVDSANGNRNWTKTFGTLKEDALNTIFQSKDENLISSGSQGHNGTVNSKFWVVKMNGKGDTLWQKCYYQNPAYATNGFMSKAEDDGFIAVLNESKAAGFSLCYMMRLNNVGIPVWTKTFDQANFEVFNSVLTTSDTSYVALGHFKRDGHGDYELFIVKLDKYGNMDSCCVKTSFIQTKSSPFVATPHAQNMIIPAINGLVTYTNTPLPLFTSSSCTPKIKSTIINAEICSGTNYVLPGGGSTNKPGTYVKNYPTKNGCDSSIITNLRIKTLPKISLKDSALCEYDLDTIKLKVNNFRSYKWMPSGETSNEITITRPGKYSVTAINWDSCIISEDIFIESNCEPTLFVPNAFSPNGDHLNDFFGASGVSIKLYQLLIYDRWGEKLFESKDIHDAWDGNYQGNLSPEGVYVYILYARGIYNKSYYKKGTFTLLR